MREDGVRAERKGLSRRTFLKGAGGVLGTTALAAAAAPETAAQAPQSPPGEVVAKDGIRTYPATGAKVKLRVNGKEIEALVTPAMSLLDVLREQMNLTGSKEVCGRGACGACTVMLNGRSVNSCLLPAIDAVGAEVTTVEGLEKDGRLDPVQAAFVANDACQCGYCIPGFVVRTRALLNEIPKPTIEQIRTGLSGNICRCGAYVRIFQAATQAIKGGRA
jgi:aerobic-type carbon monoxide dehydrogenase small subunit (CoxS/CutS family)